MSKISNWIKKFFQNDYIDHKGRNKKEKVNYLESPDGQRKIYLLNPAQKGRKYAEELHTGKDKYKGTDLTPTQKAYRSGYMKSRSDNAKAHNYNKNKRAEKRAQKGNN